MTKNVNWDRKHQLKQMMIAFRGGSNSNYKVLDLLILSDNLLIFSDFSENSAWKWNNFVSKRNSSEPTKPPLDPPLAFCIQYISSNSRYIFKLQVNAFIKGPSLSFQQNCCNTTLDPNTQNNKFEPVHEISNNVACATSKASDQPAHKRSLIRAFASRLNILWVLSYWLSIFWSF